MIMEELRRRCDGRRGALGDERRPGHSSEQLRPWERDAEGEKGPVAMLDPRLSSGGG
jgi:hypothetical protein